MFNIKYKKIINSLENSIWSKCNNSYSKKSFKKIWYLWVYISNIVVIGYIHPVLDEIRNLK